MTKSIGARIKEALAKSKMTQVALAKEIGVFPQDLNRWTRGERNPSSKYIGLLAEALDTSADWLLTGKGGSYEGAERLYQETKDESALLGQRGARLRGIRTALRKLAEEEKKEKPRVEYIKKIITDAEQHLKAAESEAVYGAAVPLARYWTALKLFNDIFAAGDQKKITAIVAQLEALSPKEKT